MGAGDEVYYNSHRVILFPGCIRITCHFHLLRIYQMAFTWPRAANIRSPHIPFPYLFSTCFFFSHPCLLSFRHDHRVQASAVVVHRLHIKYPEPHPVWTTVGQKPGDGDRIFSLFNSGYDTVLKMVFIYNDRCKKYEGTMFISVVFYAPGSYLGF